MFGVNWGIWQAGFVVASLNWLFLVLASLWECGNAAQFVRSKRSAGAKAQLTAASSRVLTVIYATAYMLCQQQRKSP